jgi:CRISPR-associated protein Csd1
VSLLERWAQSEHSNKKIKSVYSFVKNGKVADILRSEIAEMNVPGGIAANNVFIRWVVNIPCDARNETWRDPKIHQLWMDFYSQYFLEKTGFCYVSGKNGPIAELHPAKIRYAGDSAKIISSNDAANYTFRGRFTKVDEACQIGMVVTTKAHNALRWLISQQGTTIGNGLTVVAWCSASDVKSNIFASTCDALGWDDDDESVESQSADPYSTEELYAKKINDRLHGYYSKIQDNDKIIIMALNAATLGRMSILLYREFLKSDFCEAQKHWHIHLAWYSSYSKKGEKWTRHTISAPSPEEIAKTAYGEQVNDKVKTMALQRLLACIIDKTPIPVDMEQLCFCRASRLNTLDKNEREKALETACAVIKYNAYTRKREVYTVGLEEGRTTRDYLFGRLLAVADRVESVVLKERSENRESNAVRFMPYFAKYPCPTWKLLYTDKLQPYFKQLNPKLRAWYEGIIQDISAKFVYDDFVSDKALSGEFLLGYHCQQKDFWRKREKISTENGNTTQEEEYDSTGKEN